jgi:hypothetical protein
MECSVDTHPACQDIIMDKAYKLVPLVISSGLFMWHGENHQIIYANSLIFNRNDNKNKV